MKITIDLPENADVLFPEAQKLAAEHGVTFEGDTKEGSFTIKGYRAVYSVSGKAITVAAGKIPPFLTEKKLRELIEQWFNSRNNKRS